MLATRERGIPCQLILVPEKGYCAYEMCLLVKQRQDFWNGQLPPQPASSCWSPGATFMMSELLQRLLQPQDVSSNLAVN